MKKLLAWILAACTAATMTATAFAADTDILNDEKSTVRLSIGGADGLTLDGSALLTPGEEYRFPILISENGGDPRPMTVEDMDSYALKVSAQSGSSFMAEAGRLESGRVQHLSLTPAPTYGVTPQSVSYTVSLTKKSSSTVLSTATVQWKVGYPAMDDSRLGASTVIDPSAPIITKGQFAAIQKITGSERATFLGTGWQFDVRLLEQSAVNFSYSGKNIPAISNQYPQADFRFVSFGGKPAFDFYGTLYLDVSQVLDEYENLYLYRYLDGVLYSLKYTLDEEDQTIAIPTKQLGSYVISDTKIANGTAVNGAAGNGSSGSDSDKENPSTGGQDFTSMAVALGALALAGGLVLVKKK